MLPQRQRADHPSMSFTFEPQEIPDLVLIRRRLYKDERGVFSESYERSAFREFGITVDFVQDNVVFSERHVLRGLHYQLPPFVQGKLMSVSRGEILDVSVDLRRGEATYGEWVASRLTSGGGEMLWVPAGFAHGYLVLSETADLTYKVTAGYEPTSDRGIRWNDSELDIPWPISDPVLSEKDRVLPSLSEADNPF